jgi:hypothetical protein
MKDLEMNTKFGIKHEVIKRPLFTVNKKFVMPNCKCSSNAVVADVPES